jgi:periplasmic copper chaperone A
MFSHLARVAALVGLCAIGSPGWAHDYRAGALRIVHPYATPTPPGLSSAAVYLGLENRGKTPDRLVAVSCDQAGHAAIHRLDTQDGVMRMRQVEAIDIAPGGTLMMSPGAGYHLMLEGLKAPLKEGDRFVLTLSFERAGRSAVSVWVQTPEHGKAASDAHFHTH